ncbi:hypothetical protein N9V27_01160 [bacterium]|jgi:hypothetical protein|nr:hypothetical protein [bacterium]
MAKTVNANTNHVSIPKKTSIGRGKLSKGMMNKSKRRTYKAYRGQGKA